MLDRLYWTRNTRQVLDHGSSTKAVVSNELQLEEAVNHLRNGALVAFPTETVYGLGADARSESALAKLFQVKGRPTDHPVIVHLASPDWISRWALPDPRAVLLAERFWPGPLTLILQRKPGVLDAVTGGQDTVGLRMPDHPLALRLLTLFGDGLAAPSANRFGKVSPTRAQHVVRDLGEEVALVLDGGPCSVGVESTILDLTSQEAKILRPGGVTAQQLNQVLHGIDYGSTGVRAPGTLASHYAPTTRCELIAKSQLSRRLQEIDVSKTAVWSFEPPPGPAHWLPAAGDPKIYARDLYYNLRELDQSGYELILIEEPPDGEEWLACRDRLNRATA